MRDLQQGKVVGNLRAAARENERNLVGQQQLRAHHLEVADVHRNVLRLDGAAEHLDHLETLAQLHQLAEIIERAGATAVLDVHDIGRSGSGRQRHVATAHEHIVRRILRVQLERTRSAGQRLRHQAAIDADHHGVLVDLGAARGVDLACVGRQHLHALGLEHAERGLVQGCYLVV